MPKDNETVPLLTDESIASEPQPFAADLMVRCETCLRANPPTRVNCLYCAAPLPVNETTANLQKPALRPLEKWEQGYNNILLPPAANLNEGELAEAADLLKMSTDDLTRILSFGMALPLARAATSEESGLIQRRLERLRIETRIVSDEEIGAIDTSPYKVRAIGMSEDVIHAYQTPETPPVSLQWSELTLILSGLLIVKRVELKEQKSTGGQQRIADSNQFFTDELVLELFVAGQPVPYRIAVNSFDFSCLGKEKSLLTRENITRFINVIREKAPHVVYDDSYNSVRKALEPVWPSEQQNTSSGWRRERPGKYSVGSATEISNERQFSLYSRLRNLLLVGVRAD